MPINIQVPRLGWSMEEGIFDGWLKNNGEPVKSGEPLFTLESEKSSQDIESSDNGTLHIPKDSPQPGTTVKVGQVIGYLLGKDETVESIATPSAECLTQAEVTKGDAPKHKVPPEPTQTTSDTKQADERMVPASSPRARRRAAILGVDLALVQGTGRKGRITEEDVLKAEATQKKNSVSESPIKETGNVVPHISPMRRNIAERTVSSFSQIPHFYLHAEVDATELMHMREHLVPFLRKTKGIKITLTDFILRAQVAALSDFPAANAVWRNNDIVFYDGIDVGVVVGLPEGLVIPVIRGAENLSFIDLAQERARLVEIARQGNHHPELFSGGATSISNLGTTRTDEFSAIIAPHQSSMLAVGRAAPRPYVVKDCIAVRSTIKLCLSMDHRVLDGVPAAELLGKIVELLENPRLLL